MSDTYDTYEKRCSFYTLDDQMMRFPRDRLDYQDNVHEDQMAGMTRTADGNLTEDAGWS